MVLHGGNVAEQGLDLGFHLVHVNVTHDDDGLQVGTIPVVVEVFDDLVVEVLDDVEQSDGHTVGIAGVLHQDGPPLLAHTVVGTESEAVLFGDDASFGIDFSVVVEQAVRPAAQDLQAEVKILGIVERHRNHIHSLVEGGVGVEVGAEHHAQTLQLVDHRVAGHSLDAVEGHMLGEVGQTALVVVLLVGAGIDGKAEFHHLLGLGVATDVIGHPVAEFTDADTRVVLDHFVQIDILSEGKHRGKEDAEQ